MSSTSCRVILGDFEEYTKDKCDIIVVFFHKILLLHHFKCTGVKNENELPEDWKSGNKRTLHYTHNDSGFTFKFTIRNEFLNCVIEANDDNTNVPIKLKMNDYVEMKDGDFETATINVQNLSNEIINALDSSGVREPYGTALFYHYFLLQNGFKYDLSKYEGDLLPIWERSEHIYPLYYEKEGEIYEFTFTISAEYLQCSLKDSQSPPIKFKTYLEDFRKYLDEHASIPNRTNYLEKRFASKLHETDNAPIRPGYGREFSRKSHADLCD